MEDQQSNSTKPALPDTRMFDKDGLDTKIVTEGNTYDAETEDDERFFLAESEMQSQCFSDQGGRHSPNKSEPNQAFISSNIRKSERGSKRSHTIREESMEVDDGYWMRNFPKNVGNISQHSSLEQDIPKLNGQNFPSSPRLPLVKPEPTQSFEHSNIRRSIPSTKRRRTTAESTEVDEYSRSYLNITSDQSSLEQEIPKSIGQNFPSSPRLPLFKPKPTQSFHHSNIRRSIPSTSWLRPAAESTEVDEYSRSYLNITSEQSSPEQEIPKPSGQNFPSSPRLPLVNLEPTQFFEYSYFRSSIPSTRWRRTTAESTEVDEYSRRSFSWTSWLRPAAGEFLEVDEYLDRITSGPEGRKPGRRREWYRERVKMSEEFNTPMSYLEMFQIVLMLILLFVVFALFLVWFAYGYNALF